MNGKNNHIILHGECCKRLRNSVDVSTRLVRSYFSNNFAHGIISKTDKLHLITCSRAHAKTHARAKGGHRGCNYCVCAVFAALRGDTAQTYTDVIHSSMLPT